MPTLTLRRFAGVNLTDSPFELKDGQFRKLKNLLSNTESLQLRPGSAEVPAGIITDASPTDPIRGLARFYRGVGGGGAASSGTPLVPQTATNGPQVAVPDVPWGSGGYGPLAGAPWLNSGSLGRENDPPGFSRPLKLTNLGATLPATATLKGLVIRVKKLGGHAFIFDENVQLLSAAGAAIGPNKALSGAWPVVTAQDVKYEWTEAELSALNLTYADVNDADFGFQIALRAGAMQWTATIFEVDFTFAYTDSAFNPPPQGNQGTLAVASGKVYDDLSGAWVKISGLNPLTTTGHTSIVIWKNKAYFQDGENGPYKFDGTTFSTWNAPKGRFLLEDRERLYLAYIPARAFGVYAVQASDLDEDEKWTLAPTDAAQGSIFYAGKGDGDAIVGLNQLGSVKFVFKNHKTYALWGDNWETWAMQPAFSVGAVHSRLIAECGNLLIWSDGKKVYSFDGRGLNSKLGRDIEPWVRAKSLAQWQAGAMVWMPPYCIIFDGQGEAYTYDTEKDGWFGPWTLSARVAVLDRDNSLIYFGSPTAPRVYTLDPSLTTDAAVAIAWEAETKHYAFGDKLGHWQKLGRKMFLVADGALGTVTAKVRADNTAANDVTRTFNFTGSAIQTKAAPLNGPLGLNLALVLSGSGVGRLYELGLTALPIREVQEG